MVDAVLARMDADDVAQKVGATRCAALAGPPHRGPLTADGVRARTL